MTFSKNRLIGFCEERKKNNNYYLLKKLEPAGDENVKEFG